MEGTVTIKKYDPYQVQDFFPTRKPVFRYSHTCFEGFRPQGRTLDRSSRNLAGRRDRISRRWI